MTKEKFEEIRNLVNDEKGAYKNFGSLYHNSPEDLVPGRTEWDELCDYAKDLYWMLDEIHGIINEGSMCFRCNEAVTTIKISDNKGGKNVCDKCYDDFSRKDFRMWFNKEKLDESEKWWLK